MQKKYMQKKTSLVYGQGNFYIRGNGELKLENLEKIKAPLKI